MGRAFVFAAMLGLMPEACAKMLGQSPAQHGQTDPPPLLPSSTATAPPTYVPPDPGGPTITPAPPPGTVPPDLAKARAASEAKDYKKVRTILQAKVKSGKGSREEAQLLIDACGNLKDRACVEMIHKTHPEIEGL